MNKYKHLLILLLLSTQLHAQNPMELTEQEEERLYHLSQQYRCLVCQNESLADSRAELANDLRREIATQIEANKSDQEIHDYLVSRYGNFVSYEPPFNLKTIILWLIPFTVMLSLAFIVYRNSQKNQPKSTENE
ncbi:cytochrome c-type biogenesis protein [Neisseriaceae bacterium B1]